MTITSESKVRVRGRIAKEQLLQKEGGVLSTIEISKVLSVSTKTIETMRNEGKIIAVMRDNEYLYPAWQLKNSEVLAGISEVIDTMSNKLGSNYHWSVFIFVLEKNRFTEGMRPLDLLRKGNITQVLSAAREYGVQGAS